MKKTLKTSLYSLILIFMLTGCVSTYRGVDLLNGDFNKTGELKEQSFGKGDTLLENTVIRWYIDSAPRGARIFYRIISSTGDVQNTNESYLGVTPLEETRSFDIKGLSYANAGNVRVEIKVTRTGYYDQKKVYNLQQAVDQQEISGFFDLVPVEE